MSAECNQLHDFVAGELGSEEADEFRDHLGSCETCPDELGELLQLDAIEAEAAELEEHAAFEEIEPEQAEPIDELASRRRKRSMFVAGGMALAIAAAALLYLRSPRGTSEGGDSTAITIARAETRPVELRIAAADAYRPYDVMRAGELPKEDIPVRDLGKLEEQGELQRLASAYLLMREPENAEKHLATLEQTASVLSERGVAAQMRGELHEALSFFAASLKLEPNNPRVLWNQAIVNRDLGLPLSAAELFDRVAKFAEPGWAEEAAKNAAALRGDLLEEIREYDKVYGEELARIVGGEPPSLERLTKFPGIGRLLFYDAVRAGGTRDALEKLRPHAKALDAAYVDDGPGKALAAALASDLKKREPLAATYTSLLSGQRLSDAERSAHLKLARKSGASDIHFGSMLYLKGSGFSKAEIQEYIALADASSDPWHQLLAQEQRASAVAATGERRAALAILEPAMKQCERHAIAYRCGKISFSLLSFKVALRELGAARVESQRSLKWVTAAKDHFLMLSVLVFLSEAEVSADELSASRNAIAHAFLDEVELRAGDDCYYQSQVASQRSRLSIIDFDVDRAEREQHEAQAARKKCEISIDASEAYLWADLLSLRSTPQALDSFRREVLSIRESLSESDRRILDVAEVRALLPTRNEEALKLARAFEAKFDELKEPNFQDRQVRGYLMAATARDAGQRSDWRRALDTISREVGVETPKRCAVALAWEGSLVSVVLSNSGAVLGRLKRSTLSISRRSPRTSWSRCAVVRLSTLRLGRHSLGVPTSCLQSWPGASLRILRPRRKLKFSREIESRCSM